MAGTERAVRIDEQTISTLKNMNAALMTVLRMIEAMPTITIMEVDSVRVVRTELTKTGDTINQIENGVEDTKKGQKEIKEEANKTDKVLSNISKKILSIADSMFSWKNAQKAMDMSDKISNTNAKISMIVDDGGSIQELEQRIYDSANRAGADYFTMADSVAGLSLNVPNLFANNAETVQFAENLSKMFQMAGMDAASVTSATSQMAQALGDGVLKGEELNQIYTTAPNIIEEIAGCMGITVDEMKKLASESGISAETVKNALLGASGEIDQKFNEMPTTFEVVWNRFQNGATAALNPVWQKLSEIAGSQELNQFVIRAVQMFGQFAGILSSVLETGAGIGSFLYQNWANIEPVIWGIVAAIAAYNAIKTIQKLLDSSSLIMQGIQAVALLAYGAALVVAGIATGNLTLAQMGLNMAMHACPIMLIIMMIGVMVMALARWAQSVGGVKIAWLIAMNLIKSSWDNVQISFMMGIYRVMNMLDIFKWGFKAAGVGIANLIGNMKVIVLADLMNMINTAIDIINGFISLLNMIPGVNIEAVEKVTFATTAAIENEVKKQAREEELQSAALEVSQNIAKRDEEINQMKEEAELSEAGRIAEIEAAKAEALTAEEQSDYSNFDEFVKNSSDFAGNATELPGNIEDIAENTSGIKDSVDISEEDLKYLRDVAEMETINRFATAEISVDMGGVYNSISSDKDIDGMWDVLGDVLIESQISSAEGMHE